MSHTTFTTKLPTQAIDGFFAAALRQVRADYEEMPGLRLTEAQAARLWAFDATLCTAVLSALVEQHYLVKTGRAFFTRA